MYSLVSQDVHIQVLMNTFTRFVPCCCTCCTLPLVMISASTLGYIVVAPPPPPSPAPRRALFTTSCAPIVAPRLGLPSAPIREAIVVVSSRTATCHRPASIRPPLLFFYPALPLILQHFPLIRTYLPSRPYSPPSSLLLCRDILGDFSHTYLSVELYNHEHLA